MNASPSASNHLSRTPLPPERGPCEAQLGEAALQWMRDTATHGLLITDTHLHVLVWNPWLEQHSGYRTAEAVGQYLLDLYPDLIPRQIDTCFRAALAGQTCTIAPPNYSYLLPMACAPHMESLGLMQQQATITPLLDQGRVIGTITLIYDITEQILHQRALRERESFTYSVLSSLAAHVAVIDESGTIIAVNAAWEQFSAANDGDAALTRGVGLNYADACRRAAAAGDESARHCLAGIEAVLEGLLPSFSVEYPCHSPTEERWYAMSVTPLAAGGGGIVVSHTDITLRRQHERELTIIVALARALRGGRTRGDVLPVLIEHMSGLLHESDTILAVRAPDGHLTIELASGAWTHLTGQHLSDLTHLPQPGDAEIGVPGGIFRMPFVVDDQVIGELRVRPTSNLRTSSLRLLVTMGDIAANALYRTLLLDQTERQLRRIRTLHTIDLAVSTDDALPTILTILIDQAAEQLGASAVAVLVASPGSPTMTCMARRGFAGTDIALTTLPFVVKVSTTRRQVIIDGAHAAQLGASSTTTPGVIQAIPLLAHNALVGVLMIAYPSHLPVETEEQRYFVESLTGQVARAIERARLLAELQQSNRELVQAYEETIEGWSRALDLRDKEADGHSQRVTEMTMRLARALGVSEPELVHMRRGALLHDIGKVGISDSILLKPGPLTVEEWTSMHQHPLLAYDLLEPITFLQPALAIPHYHHERWDGSGYPYGLKGEHIPLAARIFAVAEWWEALRADRPHRRGYSDSEARKQISIASGIAFDPRIVAAFLTILDQDQIIAADGA